MSITLPLTVAVTGGIGAGKSTVSRGLAARGAVVLDSDQLAREVVAPGSAGLAAVVARFGDRILADGGALDRAALGAIVFGDAGARADLERITHPRVRALFEERQCAAGPDALVVNDIPLLRTSADAARYHLVITVGIDDDEVRVARLVARGHSDADARSRIAAQISDPERRQLSDVWLENSGAAQDLESGLDALWQRLSAFAANRRLGVGAPGAVPNSDLGEPLRSRILAAVNGSSLDEHRRLRADGPQQEVLEALAQIGFVALPTGGSLHRFANADPGRPVVLEWNGHG